MKIIIRGTRYDTERDVAIGSADNLDRGAASPDDPSWWRATLYRKPRVRKFYLAGSGQFMSAFGRLAVGATSREPVIRQLTDGEVYQWAETYLPPDAFAEHFLLD